MIRKSITTAIKFGSVGFLLFVLLFANGIWVKSPGFIGSALHEISAILRDSSTQWMVVLCLACYFVMLLILERRTDSTPHPIRKIEILTSPRHSPLPAGAERECLAFFRRNVFNPNLWLAALVLLVLLRYAPAYGVAVQSTQVPVLFGWHCFWQSDVGVDCRWIEISTDHPKPSPPAPLPRDGRG